MAQESVGLGKTGAGENGNANITVAGASPTCVFVQMCLSVLCLLIHRTCNDALVAMSTWYQRTSPVRFDV